MPNFSVPNKVFRYVVEIDGLEQFKCQKFTPPKVSIEKVSHGDTNYDVKTAGRYSVDDIVLEKLVPTDTVDTWALDWLLDAQDPFLGGGMLPDELYQTIIVRELAEDGTTPVMRWVYEGCWVCEVSQSDYDRTSSDNVIETVTISTNRAFKAVGS
jgi:phage tail-like protein